MQPPTSADSVSATRRNGILATEWATRSVGGPISKSRRCCCPGRDTARRAPRARDEAVRLAAGSVGLPGFAKTCSPDAGISRHQRRWELVGISRCGTSAPKVRDGLFERVRSGIDGKALRRIDTAEFLTWCRPVRAKHDCFTVEAANYYPAQVEEAVCRWAQHAGEARARHAPPGACRRRDPGRAGPSWF